MTTPGTIADLTTPWLSDVLGTGIDDLEVERIGEGVGIFGEIARLKVASAPGGPTSLIAKFPTSNPANRAVGDALGIYAREVAYFREVAPTTPLRVPDRVCRHLRR